jgi:hypothetical protein
MSLHTLNSLTVGVPDAEAVRGAHMTGAHGAVGRGA